MYSIELQTIFYEYQNKNYKKTGFNRMIYNFDIHRKLSGIHDFSVWLKTGSNPVDSNQF